MSMKKIPKRSEVLKENTWATEDIFANDEAWEKAFEKAQEYPARLATFAGKISTDAKALYEYLVFEDELEVEIMKLYSYAHLNSDVDTSNSSYQAMMGKTMAYYASLSASDSFARPEIISIDDEKMEQFYRDEPRLELYRRNLDRIRSNKPHTLSDSEERLLAGASEISGAASSIGNFFRNADLRFPDVKDGEGNTRQLTQGSYISYVESSDRVLRKSAFESLYHTFGSFRNTTAALLDAQMRQLKFFSRARNYESSLAASLSRTEVPTEVYHNLIATVHKNMPLMHRYMALRKKLMGVDELYMYDIYPTLVSEAEANITFEEAKAISLEALKPLGKDYTDVVKHAYENRWIDVYENEGKRGGAYSSGARPHPYVLLNHENNLNSMFTLVHEMGHAMHSYLSKENQPICYADYVIFVAEVASTVNELLLFHRKLRECTDDNEKLYILNQLMETYKGTLYRQTMFAEFERDMHAMSEKGTPLTADVVNKHYYKLVKKYFGRDVAVDKQISMEWMRIPHFYSSFYVYKYATCISAASAIVKRIENEGDAYVNQYIDFLKCGGSKSPLDSLLVAGIDMRDPSVVNGAIEDFRSAVAEFREIYNNRK